MKLVDIYKYNLSMNTTLFELNTTSFYSIINLNLFQTNLI